MASFYSLNIARDLTKNITKLHGVFSYPPAIGNSQICTV